MSGRGRPMPVRPPARPLARPPARLPPICSIPAWRPACACLPAPARLPALQTTSSSRRRRRSSSRRSRCCRSRPSSRSSSRSRSSSNGSRSRAPGCRCRGPCSSPSTLAYLFPSSRFRCGARFGAYALLLQCRLLFPRSFPPSAHFLGPHSLDPTPVALHRACIHVIAWACRVRAALQNGAGAALQNGAGGCLKPKRIK